MFEFPSYLNSKREKINSYLEKCIQTVPEPGRLIDAMQYSLMAGGKRLRPILCLASAEAVGGQSDNALPAACALEMIHTYSLIHDDLPTMDNDDLRRGKPTCHVQFDEATAILAGDALLTMAFQVLSGVEFIDTDGYHPKTWLKIIQRISRAAGCWGMVEGQMRDILAENNPLSRSELKRLHTLKTGAMIEAAVYSGAVLGNGTSEQIDRLEAYAGYIGLAFQVKDDLLNVEGDPECLGKSVGTDELLKKSTYPSIMGIEETSLFARQLIDKALLSLEPFDDHSNPLRAIATYIVERER